MATTGGGQLNIGRSNNDARNGGETLARILGEMSRPGINLEKRRDGDRSLRDYVEAEARDLSGQPFNRFMTSLYGTIHSHISRSVTLYQLDSPKLLTQPASVMLPLQCGSKRTAWWRAVCGGADRRQGWSCMYSLPYISEAFVSPVLTPAMHTPAGFSACLPHIQ